MYDKWDQNQYSPSLKDCEIIDDMGDMQIESLVCMIVN